jgi:hypothetical protein
MTVKNARGISEQQIEQFASLEILVNFFWSRLFLLTFLFLEKEMSAPARSAETIPA